ncbi:MAG TPA: hypothetical protein VIW01_00085 [Dehalococcoidia bacterium]
MPDGSPTVLIFETTAGDPPVEFLGDSSDIVYFISMAHSERYGADHPLAKASSAIKRRLRIPMGPLLSFGDAAPDNAAEEELLERLWQDAAGLAECARSVASAIESDEGLQEMTAALPELPERLRELAAMADWAGEQGAQVRLTFVL